jgi:eukaryotic-like serine/threonine-protein kinase
MSATGGKVSKELYEFGPFQVDAEREILLRAGDPVALPPKTFQVLLVLVRHNQEIVTKDDLMKEVWPDTFVEEANLSRNIFLLRKALGESPQDHRYVLTVPGRGYRLAEQIRVVPDGEVSIVAATKTKVQVQVRESNRWGLFAVGATLVLAVAMGVFWFARHRPPALSEKDTVVLAEFTNTTGDAIFDGTLRQGLSVQLEQSPYLSLVSDERIQQTLKLMGQPPDAHLTPDVARNVCERNGGAAVLEGSITSFGTAYVLGLRAKDCRTGSVLDEEQAQVEKKEAVIPVLSQLAGKFRERVGESLASIQKHNRPLEEATTPSLEALKAYSLGWKWAFGATGPAEAVPFFKRAVEIDPNFASAYAMLGRVYGDLGETALSTENTTKAYKLRERTTDRERYFIDLNYELQVTGNLEKARQTGELWAESYPRDKAPLGLLSFVYQSLGKYDKSADAGKAAVALDQDWAPSYANLAWAYVLSDRLDEAEDVVRRASERRLEFPDLYLLLYDIAFLKNDTSGMQRAVTLAEGKAGAEHWIAQRQACVLAYSGRVGDAKNMSRRAVGLAEQADQPERAALYLSGVASREALFGDLGAARNAATSALKISDNRDVEYGAAFALAIVGDESRTTAVIEDLGRRFPEDTYVKYSYVPTLRAILALNHGNPAGAIEDLEAAAPYDLSIPGTWFGFSGDMYPVYVRGQAYLAMHEGDRAAAEFQKIIDHRGIVASDAVAPVSRLQLARALAITPDSSRAKAAYKSFLELWKDADAGIPILMKARAEFSAMP